MMLVSKRVADILTLLRVFLSPGYLWLGLNEGELGLPLAVYLLIVSWITDILDGPLARCGQSQQRTWIGDHDLQIDMLVSAGLAAYMFYAGFVQIVSIVAYGSFWVLIFWRFGNFRSLGLLFQAPIYAWFIMIAMTHVPQAGVWLVGWIFAVLILTWPRFVHEVVPGFINGMRDVYHH